MALKVRFNAASSLQEQLAIAAEVENDILRSMRFAGESFMKEAREMTKQEGGFGDVTGNLRASIGYFILRDGELIESEFSGSGTGKDNAMRALSQIPKKKGLQLIGIAGMNYASAVESRGFNVISIQSDAALVDLEMYYKAIERKYK